jgi:hypothetical protein
MPQDDRRIIPESVIHDMDVGPTHATKRNFDFHMVRTARRLIHIEDVDIPDS